MVAPKEGRGAFIVFEGCDRSGKSTQAQRLVNWLQETQHPAKLLKFPNRESPVTGAVINAYLREEKELADAAVHLLFSANRWEEAAQIRRDLADGITLVVDRYAYSGVAFSAAKGIEGMDVEWCKGPDRRLPRPDLVLFLDVAPADAQARAGFGGERYEKTAFQAAVREKFLKLKDSEWKMMDAGQSMDDVATGIRTEVERVLAHVPNKPIRLLWD